MPDGSHVNLVIARRGSPTAAAAAAAFSSPGPGHAPVMACLGAGNAVRPATIVLNKATVASDLHGRITWGAAQLGIAAGVMDCVADGVIAADDVGELVILVAVLVDPAAADEPAVRAANRDGGPRRWRMRSRATGRPGSGICSISGTMRRTRSQRPLAVRIASIETREYRLPLDPPFPAAWDPEPRTHLDATLTIVTADDGTAGTPAATRFPTASCSSDTCAGSIRPARRR